MTKKLFVVLVVITAMLVSFSLVIGAKKASFQKGPPGLYEKQPYTQKKSAEVVELLQPGPPPERLVPISFPSNKPKATTRAVEETPGIIELGPISHKDECNMMGGMAYWILNYIWGNGEIYANIQFPYDYGCTDVFPLEIDAVGFVIWCYKAESFECRAVIYANDGDECPIPGEEICSAVYQVDLEEGGWNVLLPLPEEPLCCVYEPYFAAVEFITPFTEPYPDAAADDDGLLCQTYVAYQPDVPPWYDLVEYGQFPGMGVFYSIGHTRLQNECVEEPVCCQFDGYCTSMTPTDCINAGGTPAPDTRYECIDDECILPWEQAGCFVESVDPFIARVLAGNVATFTVTVGFIGDQISCALSATPDPACTDCGTAVFDPNPVESPYTTSTLTIQTAATTPAGYYQIEVNGAKVEAYIEVVEPSEECELYRDNEAFTSYFGSWSVGDQQAIYYDPGALCLGCEGQVYPLYLHTIKALLYNFAGATSSDVIFHIYEVAGGDPCNGPGMEICSFPVDGIDTFGDWFEVSIPEKVCVNGPFWLALEYNSGASGAIPSLLWTSQPLELCQQAVYYTPYASWFLWEDFWVNPKGFMSLRAIGTCNSGYCAPGEECNMQQDNGTTQGYASWIWEGFQIAKWYDPEVYCDAPVYPYKISDVEFVLYRWAAAADAVNLRIAVYLQCQDSCSGPGPQIYLSDVQAITGLGTGSFLIHFDLDENVCVYEPFYVALVWEAGPTPMPSFLMDSFDGIPYCHQWFYDPDVPEWVEHYDWWGTPETVGMGMIRVSGYTEHGDCAPPPCPEDVEKLAGGYQATLYWTIPDAYGDDFFNERFTMPLSHGGRLDYFDIAFYQAGSAGTPDPDFYVWLSDGTYPLDNNPPYQAIADFHLAYEDIVWFSGYTRVYTYSHAIEFEAGETFHIGFSHAQEAGDVLALLSTGNLNSDRSSEWADMGAGYRWGLMKDDWTNGGVDFLIDAYICPGPEVAPTFALKCKPSVGYATPGDPPADVYTIAVESINEYALPVTLSLLSVDPSPLPGNITAAFVPNGVAPPCTLDVTITVDASTPYNDYTLTFQGEGSDAQTRICDVTLTVQPPYDEVQVPFYHGSQRLTNFGALGDINNSADAFLWYGVPDLLFDASFIVATGPNNMAADFGTNYEHVGFVPTQRCEVYYEDAWPANIGYAEFFTDPDIIDTEWDSVFVIGIMDSCVDFSVKIKIYYNPITNPYTIEDMYVTLLEDWDMFPNPRENWGAIDPDHNLAYIWDKTDTSMVCGSFKLPFYGEPMHNVRLVKNAFYVWPSGGHGLNPDSTWSLLTEPGYFGPGANLGPDSNDFSVMITPPPITLNPGDKHIEIWIDFCRDLTEMTWEQWYHRVLRYAGFYRGDVDASDTLDLPSVDISDLVYLINYLYKGGPAPLPFADQGDVDGQPFPKDLNNPKNNVDLGDVLYLINYAFKGGPPPIDYVRFIPQYWSRPSLFQDPNW